MEAPYKAPFFFIFLVIIIEPHSIDKEKNTIKNTGINSSLKLLFVRKNEKHNKRVIVHTIEHVIPNNIIFILSIVHS